MVGLSVFGRKRYGMCRLLNFTQQPRDGLSIADNSEIKTFMEMVGLRYGKDYSREEERKTLRYGKVMLLTDQNVDGSRFKGVFTYFIHTNWPQLLQVPFMEELMTPVVRVERGETKVSFFSFAEFDKWKTERTDSREYKVKYFCGLGTNSRSEAKEYFNNIDSHRVRFTYSGPGDVKNLRKAFDETLLDQRREWLTQHMNEMESWKSCSKQSCNLYTAGTRELSFSDFVNLEYVHFVNYDNVRSMPSVVDGFTPAQRKVFFICARNELESKVNVARLACNVAIDTEYYEGERTICDTILNMARNYVGCNNINLLNPLGQFGTRLMNGKDCAEENHRLKTTRSKLTDAIFHRHDAPLLVQNTSRDDLKIEPDWYVPIIPMLLVNGSEGTSTAWSTKIPKHDPVQLIRCLRSMIHGGEPVGLTPFYRNFRGTIEAVGSDCYISVGRVAVIEDERIEITELPVWTTWSGCYKETVLDRLMNGSEPIVREYQEYHTDTSIRFVVSFAPGAFDKLRNEMGGFHRLFQLYGVFKTNEMYAIDSGNTLRRYGNTNDILTEFYNVRLRFYEKRKEYLEAKLTAEANKLSNQVRFIQAKTGRDLLIENQIRCKVIETLIQHGYSTDPVAKWKRENGSGDNGNEESDKNFDYLMDMPLWMLTEEPQNELISRRQKIVTELSELKGKSKYDLWLDDLEVLEKELNEMKNDDEPMLGDKDTRPAENGQNVELKITDQLISETI